MKRTYSNLLHSGPLKNIKVKSVMDSFARRSLVFRWPNILFDIAFDRQGEVAMHRNSMLPMDATPEVYRDVFMKYVQAAIDRHNSGKQVTNPDLICFLNIPDFTWGLSRLLRHQKKLMHNIVKYWLDVIYSNEDDFLVHIGNSFLYQPLVIDILYRVGDYEPAWRMSCRLAVWAAIRRLTHSLPQASFFDHEAAISWLKKILWLVCTRGEDDDYLISLAGQYKCLPADTFSYFADIISRSPEKVLAFLLDDTNISVERWNYIMKQFVEECYNKPVIMRSIVNNNEDRIRAFFETAIEQRKRELILLLPVVLFSHRDAKQWLDWLFRIVEKAKNMARVREIGAAIVAACGKMEDFAAAKQFATMFPCNKIADPDVAIAASNALADSSYLAFVGLPRHRDYFHLRSVLRNFAYDKFEELKEYECHATNVYWNIYTLRYRQMYQ